MTVTAARIVVQVTLAEKRAIARTAKRLGLKAGELMRWAAQNWMLSDDDADFADMLEQVAASARRASDAVDEALAFIEASNRRIDAMLAASPLGRC